MRSWLVLATLLGAPTLSSADPVAVSEAARSAFDRMPRLQIVDQIDGRCGADRHVNAGVAYCTTENTIFLAEGVADSDAAPYLVAHVYGHAAQVRHGVADQALAAIRSRPGEEVMLRGLVTRQVECLSGIFYNLSGANPAELTDWFQSEPFTGSHWGRRPLRIGPRVSIGLEERNEWFVVGQAAKSPEACSVGEMDAGLLVAAFKG